MHPLQTRQLVLETKVEQTPFRSLGTLRPPKRPQTVVDADIHNGRVLLPRQHTFRKHDRERTYSNDTPHDHVCRIVDRSLAQSESAAIDPDSNWKLSIRGDSGGPEDVQRETVF